MAGRSNFIIFLSILCLGLIMLGLCAPAQGAPGSTPTSTGELEKAIELIESRYVDQVTAASLFAAFCEAVAKELEKEKINARELKYLTFSSTLRESMTALDKALDNTLASGKGPARSILIQKGLEAMVSSLKDDGTRYYPPGTYHVAAVESTSFKGGVGMYVDEEKDRQGRFVIVDTLDGFPAFKAGLASGDRIVKAGGREVKGLEFHQLAELIIGDIGSSLSLTVERPGSPSPREVTLERVALNPNPKTFITMSLDNSLGYLKYKFLGFRMEPDTQAALAAMKTEKGLVLDLRNNAGYPDAAISLSGLFLPRETPIATQVFRNSEKLFVARNDGAFKLPLVLLINENSSSASTIMACALRSAGRAKIVGSPSRWRYTSNEKFPLPDGSVLTVTTSYYRLPNGTTLRNRGEGATPDYPVARDPFGGNDLAKDGQVQRAIQVLQDIIKGEKKP